MIHARTWITAALLAGLPFVAHAEDGPAAKPPDDSEPVLRLEANGPTAYITALAFSPDGRTLYAAGYDKVVRVWKLGDDGQFALDKATYRIPIGPGILGVINALAVSADGNHLAVGGKGVVREGSGFKKPGVLLPKIGGMTTEMREDEGVIHLFDTRTGKARQLRGHRGPVLALAFGPRQAGRSAVLASAARDFNETENKYVGGVRLWDAEQGTALARVPGGQLGDPSEPFQIRPALDVRSTGAGAKDIDVAIAWMDGKFRIWDVASERVHEVTDGVAANPSNNTVAFLPGRTQAVTGSNGRLQLWDMPAGQSPQAAQRGLSLRGVDNKSYLPWALSLCSSSGDGKLDTAAVVLVRERNEDTLLRLVSVAGDFDFADRTVARLWPGDARIPVLATAPQGRYVAVAGRGDTHEIQIYSIDDLLKGLDRRQVLRGVGATMRHIAFATSGASLGVLLSEKDAKKRADDSNDGGRGPQAGDLVFDLKNNKLLPDASGWQSAAPLDNGWTIRGFVTRDEQKAIKARTIQVQKDGQPHGDIRLTRNQVPTTWALLPPGPFEVPVVAVAFNELGETYLFLYNGTTGEPVSWLTGHVNAIRSLAFAPDGQLLASAAEDQTVNVWTLKDFTKTLGHRGLLRGVAVRSDKGRVEIAQVEADNLHAANRDKIKVGDVVAGVVDDKGQFQALASPRAFYELFWKTKPGKAVTLRLGDGPNPREVTLTTGQGTDERKALVSLFITQRDRQQARAWFGWNPFGYYDTSGLDAERYLGWHFNPRTPDEQATCALAGEYREKHYMPRILGELAARGNLQDALDALEPPPVHTPDLELRVKEAPDDAPLDARGRLFLHEKPGTLVLTIGNLDHADYKRIGKVEWRIDDAADRSWDQDALAKGTFEETSDRERTAAIENVNWKRGVYTVRARLTTREKKPQTWTHALTLRYQPKAPTIVLATKNGQVVENNAFTVEAAVHPAAPDQGVQTKLIHRHNGKEVASWPVQGAVKNELTLLEGENQVEIVSTNLGALSGHEEDETRHEFLQVRYVKPAPVLPPTITLLKVVPDAGGTAVEVSAGQQVVVPVSKVRIAGTVTSVKEDLAEVKLAAGGKDTALANVAGKKRDLDELITLKPGVQRIEVSAKTATSALATSVLTVEFRPPLPELQLEPLAKTVLEDPVDAPEVTLRGRIILVPDQQPFSVDVLVKGDNVNVSGTLDKSTWTAKVPLQPGNNPIRVLLRNQWNASRLTEPVEVNYLRPPRIDAIEGPASSSDPLIDLVAHVQSKLPLLAQSVRLLIDGKPVEMSEDAIKIEDIGGGRWKVSLRKVPLGEKGLSKLLLLVSNADGESRQPKELQVRYTPRGPKMPPEVEFVNLGEIRRVTDPVLPVRFRVKSASPLVNLELVNEGLFPQRRIVNVSQKKPDAQGYIEVEEKITLQGSENRLHVWAVNRDGAATTPPAFINYLKLPVQLVIDRLVPRPEDGGPIAARYDKDGKLLFTGVPPGKVWLEGRVIWDRDSDAMLQNVNLARVYVNGLQQLPAVLDAAAGKLEKAFRVPIVLNKDTNNKVSLELPAGLPGRADNRSEFSLDCKAPEQGQRLHLLIVGIGEREEGTLRERLVKALQLATEKKGSKPFESFKIHGILTGRHVTRRTISTHLYLIKKAIEQQKSNDMRTAGKAMSDVVMVFYDGGEVLAGDDHYLKTMAGQDDPRSRITVEDIRGMLKQTPGGQVFFLSVNRSAPATKGSPAVDRVAKWDDPHVGVVRTVWNGRAEAPAETQLTNELESALTNEKLFGQVVMHLRKQYDKAKQKYPTLLDFDANPAGLVELVVGVQK